MSADQLCPCGFGAASNAPRCRACPVATQTASANGLTGPATGVIGGSTIPLAGVSRAPGTDVFHSPYEGRRTTDPQINTALMTYSRWKKSAGTFGPAGRIIATLLLLLPLTLAAAAIATGIGMIGGGIYIFVIMPWALRDIWKKAATAVQPPRPAGGDVRPRF
jgi:hypothetical protein